MYQKVWPDDVQFLRYAARQTDGRTEKVTCRGGCPPKNYKSNGAIINKVKILKTFNCLGLDILALGYSSHFFIIDSENFKLMKHL